MNVRCPDGHVSADPVRCSRCRKDIPQEYLDPCPACGTARSGPYCGRCGRLLLASFIDENDPLNWEVLVWADRALYDRLPPDAAERLPFPSDFALRTVPCARKELIIGRLHSDGRGDADVDLSTDPGVSHRHARLALAESRWVLTDLGSRNSTYLAGTVVDRPRVVTPADTVHLGVWTGLRLALREGA